MQGNKVLAANLLGLAALFDLGSFYNQREINNSDYDAVDLIEKLENEHLENKNFAGYRILHDTKLRLLDFIEGN